MLSLLLCMSLTSYAASDISLDYLDIWEEKRENHAPCSQHRRRTHPMYTSRLALANVSNPNLLYPHGYTPSKGVRVQQPQHRIVEEFPSEQERHWDACNNVEEKTAKLRPLLFNPETALQKMLDWIDHNFNNDHSTLCDPKTYTNIINLCDCLQPHQPWVGLFGAVLAMAAINRSPTQKPLSKRWDALDQKMFQHHNRSAQESLITPHYKNKIHIIALLIDHITRSTRLTPKVMFEATHTPTPLCHLLALADSVIPITLFGVAKNYNGEHAVDLILKDVTYTLSTYLLAEFTNGRPPESLIARLSQNPTVIGIVREVYNLFRTFLFGDDPTPAFASQATRHFLDWSAEDENPFRKTAKKLPEERVGPLKRALSYMAMLRPFSFLEHTTDFATSTYRPSATKLVARLHPGKKMNQHCLDELIKCIPCVSDATTNQFKSSSCWWQGQDLVFANRTQTLDIIRRIYDFFIENILPTFDPTKPNLKFSTPNIPSNATVCCTISDAPFLIVMAIDEKSFCAVFPTITAMQSITSCFECHVLLHTLINAFQHTKKWQAKSPIVPPTLPFLSALQCVTQAADPDPPYTANLQNDPSLQ